jgi:RNA polymerase sigma factor (sigma-70 family)
MPDGSLLGFLRRVRGALAPGDGDDFADGQLLQRFAINRDEAAFRALLARHGPMVLGVCRRVLRDAQDAEDAFQATFLVLARKAGAIARPERLGNWLYGVACRTGRKARSLASRRHVHQRLVSDVLDPKTERESVPGGVRPILDEELTRLPQKYRLPLVLCYLEGKSREEASRQLGWSPGTVKGRLERGRELLRSRLLRRGVALSAGTLATLFAEEAALAKVPIMLSDTTVRSALVFAAGNAAAGMIPDRVASLTHGVLQMIFLNRLKTTLVMLLVAGFLIGAGVLTYQALTARAADPPPSAGAPGVEEKAKGPAAKRLALVEPVSALILAPLEPRRFQMAGKKPLTRIVNDQETVLELQPIVDDPTSVLLVGRKAGLSHLSVTDVDGKEAHFVVVVMKAEQPARRGAAGIPSSTLVSVWVAKRDLPAGTVIENFRDDFKVVQYVKDGREPTDVLHLGANRGKKLKRALAEDQPVKAKDVTDALLPVPVGMAAVAVRWGEGPPPEGLVPGAHVDITLETKRGDKTDKAVVEDLLVLAVDAVRVRPGAESAGTVTLAAPPETAKRIAEATKVRVTRVRKGS